MTSCFYRGLCLFLFLGFVTSGDENILVFTTYQSDMFRISTAMSNSSVREGPHVRLGAARRTAQGFKVRTEFTVVDIIISVFTD